ncbi:MAG TPA: tyrosine-type recombinase/integrase [Desulfosporosinus sp.]|nr:tyrosine-type recombinase/integrase [Desulfosporosinus sp.]
MSTSPKTLNVLEQHQLLDALLCKDGPHTKFRKGIRNYLIGCLLLEAGMRVGEVVKLEFQDLYFKGLPVKSLVIRSEVAKNGKERIVHVSTRLTNAIQEYRKMNCWFEVLEPNHKVFTAFMREEPMTTRQIERILFAAGLAALNRPVNPHMLRHTFASKLMRVTDMRTVQELLGHSNISTTQIYTHPNEDDKKKAIERMDCQD